MSFYDEMQSHIAMRAEANERAGMDPVEARRAAERAFGNRGRIGEQVRAVSVPVWLEQAGQDLRYAIRGIIRSPGFASAAVAALAVGIGASTAVFSFVDRILFRPLPYANERELVWFGMTAPIGSSEFILEQNYTAWRNRQTPFAAMTVTAGVGDCSLSELNPVRLRCSRVASNFLSVFGYRPLAGRDFSEEDARVGAPQTALISPALWKARFGGGDVSAKTMEVDGNRTVVIGVLPENFEMPSLAHVDVLQVLQLEEKKPESASSLLLTPFARLRPGVTLAEARARMEPLFQEGLQSVPRGFRKEVHFVINPLRDRQVRDSERAALLLFGSVCLVLLIAVANVANLLLARTAARRRELAVRAAIGAGKARLARQAFTESLFLGVLGGVSGLLVGAVLLRVFRELAPAGIARLGEATIDWRIAGFSLAATIMASMLFGLAPAMRRPSPEALTGGRVAGRRREWLRPALVVAQIGSVADPALRRGSVHAEPAQHDERAAGHGNIFVVLGLRTVAGFTLSAPGATRGILEVVVGASGGSAWRGGSRDSGFAAARRSRTGQDLFEHSRGGPACPGRAANRRNGDRTGGVRVLFPDAPDSDTGGTVVC